MYDIGNEFSFTPGIIRTNRIARARAIELNGVDESRAQREIG